MKKQILNIGKALNRVEQKQIFGGNYLYDDGGLCNDACNSGNKACPIG